MPVHLPRNVRWQTYLYNMQAELGRSLLRKRHADMLNRRNNYVATFLAPVHKLRQRKAKLSQIFRHLNAASALSP